MDDPSRIFVAFHKDNLGFILINYIPYSVTGLRRGWYHLVTLSTASHNSFSAHSCSVTWRCCFVQGRLLFTLPLFFSYCFPNKVDYASLTVDNLGNLTPTSIHKALRNPTIPHIIGEMESPETVRRSFSEFYSPSTSRPATMPKSQSMFSNFIRRTKRSHTLDEQTLPPPPPPKDDIKYTSRGLPTRGPISEFAVIESGNFGSDDEDVVVVSQPDPRPSQFALPSKWVSDSVVIADPAERARRRRVALKQRELEEAQAIEEEKDRQARIQLRKEEMLREEQRQEAERQAMMDKEIKRAQAERRKKVQLEKEEDDRKRIELAARRADAKLKRQQEHARLEEWRRAQRASAEESSKKEAELHRQERAEKEKRLKQMEVKVKSTLRAGETGQGWASIQTSESIVWRRRYYKVYGDVISFYRSPKVNINIFETRTDAHHTLQGNGSGVGSVDTAG